MVPFRCCLKSGRFDELNGDILGDKFGGSVDHDKMVELVCSVVSQWQKYSGVAALSDVPRSLGYEDGRAIFEQTNKGIGGSSPSFPHDPLFVRGGGLDRLFLSNSLLPRSRPS